MSDAPSSPDETNDSQTNDTVNASSGDATDKTVADAYLPEAASISRQSEAPKQRGGISAGMWVALISGAIILILLLVFVIQNNHTTTFTYFTWEFTLPLGVAMLLAAIAGVLIAGLIGSVRMFVLSRHVKKLRQSHGDAS